jgi:hypothetical protein
MRRLLAIIAQMLAIGATYLLVCFSLSIIWAAPHLLYHPMFWVLMAGGSIVATMLRAVYIRLR